MNGSSPYLPVAKEISTYLTLGMHHSTPEAQQRMAELIEEGIEKVQQDEAKRFYEEWEKTMARLELDGPEDGA
jgi:hypothetical protein